MSKNPRAALYARCSTSRDQNPEIQISELTKYAELRNIDVHYCIQDAGFSGSTDKRPGLQKLLSLCRSRQVDVVIVLKFDRLFRSLKHLLTTLQEFSELGIDFISVKDQVDLTTSSGRLMLNILGSFSEFERDLIKERTLLGLDHARRSGKTLGRPTLTNPVIETEVLRLRANGLSYRQIQQQLNLSKGVVCRILAAAPKSIQKQDDFEQLETRSYGSK